jgi:(S)-ureidoglycine aminohydrolase
VRRHFEFIMIPTPLGTTRTTVRPLYALIAPDSHVPSVEPGWGGTAVFVLVSPGMGARLTQALYLMEAGGRGAGHTHGEGHFYYVVEGGCRINGREVAVGGFAFVPPGGTYEIVSGGGARLLLFAKKYEVLPGVAVPAAVFGDAKDVAAQPFLGDPAARLQALLPDDPAFDMAVNIFTYDPGGTLPFVECHIMEHGMLILEGAGVYKLGDDWHPVQAGDALWLAPYCPQWFVAMGKTPTRYIYYKDVNRAPRLG